MTAFAAAHPHAAGGLVFLAAVLESVAIVGAIVPGTAIVVAVGALIALGHLNLWVILAATAAGAIAGDGVPFWIGHRYRNRLSGMWPFAGRPELLARGEAYIVRRGAAGILIARFVPVLRSTVPVAAGMLGMDVRRFYLANIGSALVWAPAHVLPGLLAGTALAGLGAVSLRWQRSSFFSFFWCDSSSGWRAGSFPLAGTGQAQPMPHFWLRRGLARTSWAGW